MVTVMSHMQLFIFFYIALQKESHFLFQSQINLIGSLDLIFQELMFKNKFKKQICASFK